MKIAVSSVFPPDFLFLVLFMFSFCVLDGCAIVRWPVASSHHSLLQCSGCRSPCSAGSPSNYPATLVQEDSCVKLDPVFMDLGLLWKPQLSTGVAGNSDFFTEFIFAAHRSMHSRETTTFLTHSLTSI